MLHLFFLNVLDVDDVQVPPWWIANDYPCWEMIVDRWCSQEWLEMHEAAVFADAWCIASSGQPKPQGVRG